MINNQRSVEVLGTKNTVDFERVMNHFSSSFTESYLKVMDLHFGNGIQLNQVEEKKPEVIKPKIKVTPIPKVDSMNVGFEKLKNLLLRTELEKCKSVEYDESKFITIKELGFKTIYDLDKRSKGFWSEYFSKYKVYLRKGLNTQKISQKVLFDRNILGMIKGKKSEQKSSGFSLPEWLRNNPRKKREVIKGGKHGKIKGFNFYFQKNEKLKPFQRKKLLELSEGYISKLIDEETQFSRSIEMIDNSFVFLDSTHTDEELKGQWNLIYEKYGMRIPQMERRWYRDNEIPDIGEIGEVSEPLNNKVVEYLNSKKGFKKVYDF